MLGRKAFRFLKLWTGLRLAKFVDGHAEPVADVRRQDRDVERRADRKGIASQALRGYVLQACSLLVVVSCSLVLVCFMLCRDLRHAVRAKSYRCDVTCGYNVSWRILHIYNRRCRAAGFAAHHRCLRTKPTQARPRVKYKSFHFQPSHVRFLLYLQTVPRPSNESMFRLPVSASANACPLTS